MNFSFLLLIGIAFVAVDPVVGKCSKSEHSEVTKSHERCVQKARERFPKVTRETFGSYQICDVFDEIIIKCGDLLRKCLNEKEHRQMLDNQMEAVLGSMRVLNWDSDKIRECAAVVEYEQSGRKEIVDPTEKCSSEQIKELGKKYEGCTLKTLLAMPQRAFINPEKGKDLQQIMCEEMEKIVNGCGMMLTSCYNSKQVAEFKAGIYKPVQKMWLKKTKDSKEEIDLNKCSAFSSVSTIITESTESTESAV